MDKRKLIGLRIKELRKRKDFSQEDLAEKAETSANYLSRMERGTENPTLDMLIKISDALMVEMWELFDFGHEVGPSELKKALSSLTKELDEEKLKDVVKVVRALVR